MEATLGFQSIYQCANTKKTSLRNQILLGLLLFVALAVKVWIKLEVTDIGYKLAEARNTAIEQDMNRRDLELQLSILKRPDNLASMASERLGLKALNPGKSEEDKVLV